jgi:hypothetical protein
VKYSIYVLLNVHNWKKGEKGGFVRIHWLPSGMNISKPTHQKKKKLIIRFIYSKKTGKI